jgi:hypothetical protein
LGFETSCPGEGYPLREQPKHLHSKKSIPPKPHLPQKHPLMPFEKFTKKDLPSRSLDYLGLAERALEKSKACLLEVDIGTSEPPIRIYKSDIQEIKWRHYDPPEGSTDIQNRLIFSIRKTPWTDLEQIMDKFSETLNISSKGGTFEELTGDGDLIGAALGHSIYRFSLHFIDEISKIICKKQKTSLSRPWREWLLVLLYGLHIILD